ncbi:MAG: histidinol-phosphatase HisJ family protein [bacterium]|nr:MAG: histidinol-phosphatase HisJ family protein [bacterium]
MIDYHLHGNFCGHGRGSLEEYVSFAIERGFKEIGFSAHLPKIKNPDPYHAMPEEDLPRYVELVEELRGRYRERIVIKLGIEADYFEGLERVIGSLLDAYPFDYVFGAIHFLGDWHFTSKAGRGRYELEDPNEAYPAYFELVKLMIRSGLFDILAHPDAIRREGFIPDRSMTSVYRDIAGLLKQAGMAIEVNTAGVRRGVGGVYPEKAFLSACRAEGVPVTIGSDAHDPHDVGRDYDYAVKLLESLRISEVATYHRRRMTLRPLRDFFRDRADGNR